MPSSRAVLARLRKIIEAWPETHEKISHGAPTWWGGRKTFATLHHDHHGDGRLAVWIKTTHDQQAELVESNPDLFYVPPYVGVSGWVAMRLDLEKQSERSRATRRTATRGAGRDVIDWSLVEGLLEQGYRSVAPRRAIKQLDEG